MVSPDVQVAVAVAAKAVVNADIATLEMAIVAARTLQRIFSTSFLK
ncbi:MAG: hypothetical protein LIO41_06225 [Ruminococcus sp.]|nr:hypothetical protein [Ruminococcus sp.]